MRSGYLTWLSPHWTHIDFKPVRWNGVVCYELNRINQMSEISFVDSPAQVVTAVGIDGEYRYTRPRLPPTHPERARL